MEMSVHLSRHADQRLRQRALRERDVALILASGTDLGDGRIVLQAVDAQRAIAERKREIERLQHLRGAIVVARDERLVTAYRADTERRKRRLRQAAREALR